MVRYSSDRRVPDSAIASSAELDGHRTSLTLPFNYGRTAGGSARLSNHPYPGTDRRWWRSYLGSDVAPFNPDVMTND